MTQIEIYLQNLYHHSLNCSAKPLAYLGCNNFWGVVFFIAILLCAYIFIKAASYLYVEYQQNQNYQKKLIERTKIAEPEIMSAAKWSIDDNFDDFSHEQIARSFRNELNKT